MPTLTGVTYRTVTGSFRRFTGGPAVGTVSFQPSVRVVTSNDDIVLPDPIEATLDGNGDISVSLPVNDDADMNPTGWTYLVIERIDGGKRSWSFPLPTDDGTPVDLADIAPTDPVSPATSYILASAVAGLVTADDLTAEATARAAADSAEAVSRAAGDAAAVQRANHTGTQLAATISDFATTVDARIVAVVIKAFVDALGVDAATLQGQTVAQLTTAITAAIVDSAPGTLDTLNELAAALGDDPNFVTTMTNLIAAKVALSLFDANTFLAADTDNTPTARAVGEGLVLGRPVGGLIKALTDAEFLTILRARLDGTYVALQAPAAAYLAAPSGDTTGVTDTARIEAAIASLGAAGGTVFAWAGPNAGPYWVSHEIAVPEHVAIEGFGVGYENYGYTVKGTTFKLIDASGLSNSQAVFRFKPVDAGNLDSRHQGGMRRCTVHGNNGDLSSETTSGTGTNNVSNGVIVQGCRFITFDDVFIVRCGTDGFRAIANGATSSNDIRLVNTFSGYNHSHGYNLAGGDCGFGQAVAGANGLDGFRVVLGAGSFDGCQSWNNLRDGLSISNSATVKMINVTGGAYYDNARSGISCDSGVTQVAVTGAACHGNGTDATTYPTATDRAGIRVIGTPTSLAITGCILGNRSGTFQQYGIAFNTAGATAKNLDTNIDAGNTLALFYKDGAAQSKLTGIVAHGESQVAFSNDNSEKTYWSYTIPAKSLKAGDRIRIWMSFDLLNNSSGAVTYLPKLYVGASQFVGASSSIAQSANRRKGVAEFIVTCVGDTAQVVSGRMEASAASTSDLVAQTNITTWSGFKATTEDTTTAKVLKFTLTMGTADTNADFRLQSYMVEKLDAAY